MGADTNGDGQLDWDEFKRVMQVMPELQALSMDAGNALDSVKGDVDPAEMAVILKMTFFSTAFLNEEIMRILRNDMFLAFISLASGPESSFRAEISWNT